VHVQLLTRSKMFCPCPADYQTAPPNSRVCPVCLGLPGALPVINRRAVEFTIMTGLALHCSIPGYSKFDRKNYPYPDLMKGYQISQYDMPLATGGYLEIPVDEQTRRVGVTRVHLEEDVAKLQHFPSASLRAGPSPAGESYSLVDVNRSGVPLMEVVGDPDLRSPEEARAYLMALHSIVQYLGVSTANMQDGSFRCDANVSIRPRGDTRHGTRTEVKNMNSFRSVFLALAYEVERQRQVLEDGGRVVQETRGWVEERGVTVSQRSKEQAHDYRYFPEPDLPPLSISPQWVEELRRNLPELPVQRKARLMGDYGLPEYDAALLTGSRRIADYFEEAVRTGAAVRGNAAALAKPAANWILGDLTRLLNAAGQDIGQSKVTPGHLAELIDLIEAGTLSTTLAKTVLEQAFQTGQRPVEIVQLQGYAQISDAGVVEAAVAQAIEANPKAAADFRSGKESAARFLVGQVMKLTKGQAKPELVNELVRKRLAVTDQRQ
jgi:aspartyl-tRNA(Asn)/glutamyl-tRNA(Gln) amidotransferase subunit B